MADNIQVVVRCRGRNAKECAAKSPSVVELPSTTHTPTEPFVTIVNLPPTLLTPAAGRLPQPGKTFRVDQVYGPQADQALIFDNVASPLFNDFVAGLNVTILAYGQTGSGKTHTMCGELQGDNAGIVPRVLGRLFSQLQTDHVVKLSCVELHNEELRDLVNDELRVGPAKLRLKLVDDNSKKAQGTIVQGLSEVLIDNTEMGFKILQKCLGKRRTGATKLNDKSSRSHTILSIILCKRASSELEYSVSRMNLVDLAGSEDINKSGAVNERAREAGLINQSLLSLGKLINQLSEGKDPASVSYRDSKLTRLLKGSIGGRTKTALIATISPAKVNVHETLSTLNYASKAKNIRNLPQSSLDNDTVLKKVLVSDLSSQIARLTRDLMASRDKDDGIKMSLSNYNDYSRNISELRASLQEKTQEADSLRSRLLTKTEAIETLEAKTNSLSTTYLTTQKENDNLKLQIATLKDNFVGLQSKHTQHKQQFAAILKNDIQKVVLDVSDAIGGMESGATSGKSLLRERNQALSEALDKALAHLEGSLASTLQAQQRELEQHLSQQLKDSLNFTSALSNINSFTISPEMRQILTEQECISETLEQQLVPKNFEQIIASVARNATGTTQQWEDQLKPLFQMMIKRIHSETEATVKGVAQITAQNILKAGKADLRGHLTTSRKRLQSTTERAEHKVKELHETSEALQHKIDGGKAGIAEQLNRWLASTSLSILLDTQRSRTMTQIALKDILQEQTSEFDKRITNAAGDTKEALQAIAANLSHFDLKIRQVGFHKSAAESIPEQSPRQSKRRKVLSTLDENDGFLSRIPQIKLRENVDSPKTM